LGSIHLALGAHHFEQATTNPEAAAKRKLARNVGKKESRKRKNRAFA
jgi:hypothetical protein